MKRIRCFIWAIILIGMLMFANDYYYASESIIASGKCGDDITLSLDSKGHLVLSGTGKTWWDGSIADDEIPDFINIQKELERISVTVEALQLWAEQMIADKKINIDKYNEIING